MDPLLILIAILAFASVTLLTMGLVEVGGQRGSRLVAQRESQNQRVLEELFIRDVTPRQVTAITAGSAVTMAALVLALMNSVLLAGIAGAAVVFVPQFVFSYMRARRLERFNDQLPDALGVLATSTRAGMSLTQAIEQVAEQMEAPISEEFGMIVQEMRLGSDLGRAIETARTRIGSRTFRLVATALQINREKGGNLPETLDTMASSLQEIWRLDQKLITASAEGRKAVRVISVMPVLLFLFVAAFQPELPAALVGSLPGIAILVLALVLYGAGLWWLNSILSREV